MNMDSEEIKGVFFFPYLCGAFHLLFLNDKPAYRMCNQCVNAAVNIVFEVLLYSNGGGGFQIPCTIQIFSLCHLYCYFLD